MIKHFFCHKTKTNAAAALGTFLAKFYSDH